MSQDRNKSNHAWTRAIVLIAGLALAISIGVMLLWPAGVYAQLRHWKLLPQPELYTELSFEHSQTLPTLLTLDPIPFAFDIHNVMGRQVAYPYIVQLREANGAVVRLAGGTITIKSNATARVPEQITLPQATGNSQIFVILPDQNQVIDFWLRSTP